MLGPPIRCRLGPARSKRPGAATLGCFSRDASGRAAAALGATNARSPALTNHERRPESGGAPQSVLQSSRASASAAVRQTSSSSTSLSLGATQRAVCSRSQRGCHSCLPARAHGQGEEPSGRRLVLMTSRAAAVTPSNIPDRFPGPCSLGLRISAPSTQRAARDPCKLALARSPWPFRLRISDFDGFSAVGDSCLCNPTARQPARPHPADESVALARDRSPAGWPL